MGAPFDRLGAGLREEIQGALVEALRQELKPFALRLQEDIQQGLDLLELRLRGRGSASAGLSRRAARQRAYSETLEDADPRDFQAAATAASAESSVVGPLPSLTVRSLHPGDLWHPGQTGGGGGIAGGTLTKLLATMSREVSPTSEAGRALSGDVQSVPASPVVHEWSTRQIRGYKSSACFATVAEPAPTSHGGTAAALSPAPSGRTHAAEGHLTQVHSEAMSGPTSPSKAPWPPPARGEAGAHLPVTPISEAPLLQIGHKSYVSRSLWQQLNRQDRISNHFSSGGFFMGVRHKVAKLVENVLFDYCMGVLVLANAAVVGVEVDCVVKRPGDPVPLGLRVAAGLFCLVFVLEIGLRGVAQGRSYFTGSRAWWNVFDLVCVGVQVVEEATGLAPSSTRLRFNVTFARVLHLLRVVRIVRSIRLLRLIGEFRLILLSITSSLKNLVWTVFLMCIVTYVVSMWFTQLVAERRLHPLHADDDQEVLLSYYGSLPASLLCLFAAATGGVNWKDVLDPLMDDVSPVMAVVFCLYICFVIFAIMNIVTGVFVEAALRCAKDENDIFMINNVREIFLSIRGQMSGTLTLPDFEQQADSSAMKEYFKEIDVDPSEAKELFRLLDLDSSGAIDAEEFLSGCLRLRGPAKALDLALLRHELKQVLLDSFAMRQQQVQFCQALAEVVGTVEALPQDGGGGGGEPPGNPPPAGVGPREAALGQFAVEAAAMLPESPLPSSVPKRAARPHVPQDRRIFVSAPPRISTGADTPLPHSVHLPCDGGSDSEGSTARGDDDASGASHTPSEREMALQILRDYAIGIQEDDY